MARIKFGELGRIESVIVNGVDISDHIMRSPAPYLTTDGNEIGVVVRLALEHDPFEAAREVSA